MPKVTGGEAEGISQNQAPEALGDIHPWFRRYTSRWIESDVSKR